VIKLTAEDVRSLKKTSAPISKSAAEIPEVFIIKGNPAAMKGKEKAYDAFYQQVADLAAQHGRSVAYDEGLPKTVPPGGKIWIGHSRGADRLRFAPEGVETLRLDDYEQPTGNVDPLSGLDDAHHTLSPEAVAAISKLLGGAQKAASALPQLQTAKKESDRGHYIEKHRILEQLMRQRPDDWIVDDASGKYFGVTHVPTGFRLHAPKEIIPLSLKQRKTQEVGDE
jgi:hypothetical protein